MVTGYRDSCITHQLAPCFGLREQVIRPKDNGHCQEDACYDTQSVHTGILQDYGEQTNKDR